MTKWVITGLVVASVFFFAVLYVAHPEVIEAQAKKISTPFSNFQAGREAGKYAKSQGGCIQRLDGTLWGVGRCVRPATALKAEECANQEEQWKSAFERHC